VHAYTYIYDVRSTTHALNWSSTYLTPCLLRSTYYRKSVGCLHLYTHAYLSSWLCMYVHVYTCMYTHPANAYVHVRCRRWYIYSCFHFSSSPQGSGNNIWTMECVVSVLKVRIVPLPTNKLYVHCMHILDVAMHAHACSCMQYILSSSLRACMHHDELV
jgi:hypothetical protein